ncbi:uncharacterized protein RJT20DRAFT_587 [Scheffersomyces xylosifermentans]|uniref:uncharacterized protein n=1 Tax=Scheffersomyces xylosifermentans TaxID=1304137 RepID=UPI00315C65B8
MKFLIYSFMMVTFSVSLVDSSSTNIPSFSLSDIIPFNSTSQFTIERFRDHLNTLKLALPLQDNDNKIQELRNLFNLRRSKVSTTSTSKTTSTKKAHTTTQVPPTQIPLQIADGQIPFIPIVISSTEYKETVSKNTFSENSQSVNIPPPGFVTPSIDTIHVTRTITEYITMHPSVIPTFDIQDYTEHLSDLKFTSSPTNVPTETPTQVDGNREKEESAIHIKELRRIERLIEDLREDMLRQKKEANIVGEVISLLSNHEKNHEQQRVNEESELKSSSISISSSLPPSSTVTEVYQSPASSLTPNETTPQESITFDSSVAATATGSSSSSIALRTKSHGKGAKDLLNSKTPENKILIGPQFRFHNKEGDSKQYDVGYSKPKQHWNEEVQQHLTTSSTSSTSPSTAASKNIETSFATEVKSAILSDANLDQELLSYLKTVYPEVANLIFSRSTKVEPFNQPYTSMEQSLYLSASASVSSSSQETTNPDKQSQINSTEFRQKHHSPDDIMHVPKELQDEAVISNAFKTFQSKEELSSSYIKEQKQSQQGDQSIPMGNDRAKTKTFVAGSTHRDKGRHRSRHSRNRSDIDFDVFGVRKESTATKPECILSSLAAAAVAMVVFSFMWM